jgi:dTDP-4-amino-4,6-dideoxygalactose transaminase
MMKIPYRDLSVKSVKLRNELLAAVEKVLLHGRFIFGPEHEEFEAEMARYCNRKYCVGVGSGTDALYFALRALNIGKGDEVITTPLSWIATVNAIALTGATPVFVDIGSDLNINTELIEKAVTPSTKVILPVHFTGQMSNMTHIIEIAEKYKLTVLEDGAQAFGAAQGERKCGSFGALSCFSMNPMKVYNAFGEAGAVLTDEERLRNRLVALRYNGTINKQDCHYPSLNGRLDTIQAAMLLVNLNYLEEKIEKRREIAALYNEELREFAHCPEEHPGNRHIYYAYTVLVERRDDLMSHLASRGIETQIQHPLPMPYHTAYKGKFKADIPMCKSAVTRILCLPNHEDLTKEEVHYVCKCIKEFYGA